MGTSSGRSLWVTLLDAGGNTATVAPGSTDHVGLTIGTNPSGGTLSGCTETTTAGVATFSGCLINNPGQGYTLVANDTTTTGVLPATSSPFNIVTPELTSFLVSNPGTQTAGGAFSVTITALDQSGFTFPGLIGAQAIAFSGPANSPSGTPPVYPATVNFTNGIGTATGIKLFNASTTTNLTASLTGATGSSGNFTVSPATASTFTVAGFPTTVAAGTAGSVTVTAADAYGNVASGYTGTVHFTSTDGQATLPANYIFTTGTGKDNGVHTFTNGVTLKTVGTQSITATNTVTPVITGTESGITVTKASPSIGTTLSAGSINPGGTAHDSATLSGSVNSTGAGTVTYSYYTNNTCTTGQVNLAPVTVSTAGAVPNSATVTFNTAGTYYWQAVYSGDANNNGATSPCTAGNNEQLIVKANPTISTLLSAASISAGGTVNDTATLTGSVNSTGTATVTYNYYTNNFCTTGKVTVGTVTVSTAGMVPNSATVTFGSFGTYYWQAVYSGDASNNGATSTCTSEQLTVAKANPTIATTLSAASISAGATANDSAMLSGAGTSTGTGTVAYSYYTNNACTTGKVTVGTVTVPASGVVPNSATVTFGSIGTYYWQAVYSGDANNNGATSPCASEQLTVTKANPTIATTLSTGSINPGGTAHDSATLSGAGTSTGAGTVTYSYYTNNTCTTGQVNLAPVTVSTAGAVPNSATVTFNTAGTYYWQAVYSGDANNNGATSPCTAGNNEQLIVKANPTISTLLSAASISAGGTVNDTATLTGSVNSTGTATVTYNYYTNNFCTTGKVTVGTVTVSTAGMVPNSATVTFGSFGTYYWQAVYSGDASNNGATSTCTSEQLTVAKANPTIATTLSAASISAGATANDSATLTGSAERRGHRHLQLLHQQHLLDGEGEPGRGDGDRRGGAELGHRHLQHGRHLLLAGGLLGRRQQQRGDQHLHLRTAHGEPGVAEHRHHLVGGQHQRPAPRPTTARR